MIYGETVLAIRRRKRAVEKFLRAVLIKIGLDRLVSRLYGGGLVLRSRNIAFVPEIQAACRDLLHGRRQVRRRGTRHLTARSQDGSGEYEQKCFMYGHC